MHPSVIARENALTSLSGSSVPGTGRGVVHREKHLRVLTIVCRSTGSGVVTKHDYDGRQTGLACGKKIQEAAIGRITHGCRLVGVATLIGRPGRHGRQNGTARSTPRAPRGALIQSPPVTDPAASVAQRQATAAGDTRQYAGFSGAATIAQSAATPKGLQTLASGPA